MSSAHLLREEVLLPVQGERQESQAAHLHKCLVFGCPAWGSDYQVDLVIAHRAIQMGWKPLSSGRAIAKIS